MGLDLISGSFPGDRSPQNHAQQLELRQNWGWSASCPLGQLGARSLSGGWLGPLIDTKCTGAESIPDLDLPQFLGSWAQFCPSHPTRIGLLLSDTVVRVDDRWAVGFHASHRMGLAFGGWGLEVGDVSRPTSQTLETPAVGLKSPSGPRFHLDNFFWWRATHSHTCTCPTGCWEACPKWFTNPPPIPGLEQGIGRWKKKRGTGLIPPPPLCVNSHIRFGLVEVPGKEVQGTLQNGWEIAVGWTL